jgi:hypothetical protein
MLPQHRSIMQLFQEDRHSFCPSEPADRPDLALERRMRSPCRLSGVLKAARPALPLHQTDVLRY